MPVQKLKAIEAKEGRAMSEILTDLYAVHGRQIDVARALGISQSTLSLWLVRLGLQERAVLVPKKELLANE